MRRAKWLIGIIAVCIVIYAGVQNIGTVGKVVGVFFNLKMCIRDRLWESRGGDDQLIIQFFTVVGYFFFGIVDQAKECLGTVSYTHLDVYKRQFKNRILLFFALRISAAF